MRWLLIAFLMIGIHPANAHDGRIHALEQWFPALEEANTDKLATFLNSNFSMVITDFDVTQTRTEFLDSMDNWKDAIAGGSIKYKIMEEKAEGLDVLTCYDFGESQSLVSEMMNFNTDAKLIKIVQTEKAKTCEGF